MTSIYEQELAALAELDHILQRAHVAESLYAIDGGKTLSTAVNRLADAGLAERYGARFIDPELDGQADEENDPATIQGAMKIANEAGEPWRAKPIKLNANRSKVRFNGVSAKPDAPTKTFNSIVNKSTSDFNKLTSEDQLDNHRSANKELDWVDPERDRATASKVKMIKDACRKSREAREQDNPFKLSSVAESILSKKSAESRALKEANTTAAARTLQTYRVDEPSVRDQLPNTFKQSGLLPAKAQPNIDNTTKATTQLPTDDVAIRMPDFDVRKSLPAEWQDAKTAALAKQKAGQLRTWNDASRSLEHQPNHEPSPADDQQEYDRNTNIPAVDGMTRTALPQPNVKGRTPNYVGPNGKHSFPNKEGQWPSDPSNISYPEETASSRSPGSRW
jgi:hypothetical protein